MVDLMANVSFSLHLKPELKHRLDEVAQNEDRSAAEVATRAIESFLDEREALRADIEAALAEADKGVFVSSEAVDRWMESWDTDNELPMPEPDIFPDDLTK